MAETKKTKTPKATKATGAAKVKKAPQAAGAETNLIRRVTVKPRSSSIPKFSTGDTINVSVKVKEGEKERTQVYKGIVTKIQGAGSARSFTVRKISAGVGVERIFPFSSPAVEKVEVVSTGKVRRSRLFYLRSLEGKAAKIESEMVSKSETTGTTEA